jgi:hypothetical protein
MGEGRWGRRWVRLSEGAGHINATCRSNATTSRTFKGPAIPTGPVWAVPTVSTPSSPHPCRWDTIRAAECSSLPLTSSFPQIAAVLSEPSSAIEFCHRWRASHRQPPRVLVRCRRSILELHHNTPVLTSLNTSATRRSSSLAPVRSSAESPPPPRALSSEPILSDVPQTSSPPRWWQMLESGQPPTPYSWRRPAPLFSRGPSQCQICRGPCTITCSWAAPDTMPAGHAALC